MTTDRRKFGAFLTPEKISTRFVLPPLKGRLAEFLWVDMYCGEGSLLLPLLHLIPERERTAFFEKRVLLFDIQGKMIERAREKAVSLGVSAEAARRNIVRGDSLASVPGRVRESPLPVWHITNPPYIYAGHIMKGGDLAPLQAYLRGQNEGYQDTYQVALMNDLRAGIDRMTYIIPTNFLFGGSGVNKVRKDFLPSYRIERAYIFETPIFEETGINACICSFKRRRRKSLKDVVFKATKVGSDGSRSEVDYRLEASRSFRAGGGFEKFTEEFEAAKPLDITFHLSRGYVESHSGPIEITVVNANGYSGSEYPLQEIYVDAEASRRIGESLLWIRTVDTGSEGGRAGLRLISEDFGEGVDGIYAPEREYRTHPIQIFTEPVLGRADQLLLRDYFNGALWMLRSEFGGDFLTTYRYSMGGRPRKYVGLSQARALIRTFPILQLNEEGRGRVRNVLGGSPGDLRGFLRPFARRVPRITDYL
jgi:methylase of polypeptide subunit release factors